MYCIRWKNLERTDMENIIGKVIPEKTARGEFDGFYKNYRAILASREIKKGKKLQKVNEKNK